MALLSMKLLAATLLASALSSQAVTTENTRDRQGVFVDVTEQLGTYHKNPTGIFHDVGGSGAAWLDMDHDGDQDLLVLGFGGDNVLFQNEDGVFADVTAASGIVPDDGAGVPLESIGAIVGDYDEDGLPDVYVLNHGHNQLYRNLGSGLFQDEAFARGVEGDVTHWSQSASWADFDRDGDIDLYAGNYVGEHSFPYHTGQPNLLFRNDGPAATWPEIATMAGVDTAYPFGPTVPGYPYVSPEGEMTAGCTLVTNTLDYDEDGYPDLQVGNDFGEFVVPNLLYHNETGAGPIRFSDQGAATGFNIGQFCMGIRARDFDHDGDWDFYSTDIGPNSLLRNDGGSFTDVVYSAGPVIGSAPRDFKIIKISSWAVFWEDVNLDTWEDLIVINGFVPAASFWDNTLRHPNDLWINQGDGTFERVPDHASGLHDEGPGRSIQRVDLNSDGHLDLYVTNNGSFYTASADDHDMLLMGTGALAGDNRWLELDLVGRLSHPDALGSRIEAEVGGTVLKRQLLGDGSYLGSPARLIHFGLGQADSVDRLTIHWPSGIKQDLIDVRASRRHEILEPAVTVHRILQPVYAGGKLRLRARVENHGNLTESCTLKLRVTAASGATIAGSVTGDLAAGAKATVTVVVEVVPAIYSAYQGSTVTCLAEVVASGSSDSEQAQVLLP